MPSLCLIVALAMLVAPLAACENEFTAPPAARRTDEDMGQKRYDEWTILDWNAASIEGRDEAASIWLDHASYLLERRGMSALTESDMPRLRGAMRACVDELIYVVPDRVRATRPLEPLLEDCSEAVADFATREELERLRGL